MDYLTIIQILDSTVRLATPLLLTCLAGLFSERAGVVDIGLEGKLLAAAFLAGAAASVTGSIWIGLLAGIAGSLAFSMIHGLASITFKGDQLISGVALNFLAAGLTVVVGQSWFKLGGRTPSLPSTARFQEWNLPFSDALADVPFLGPLYDDLISGHTALTYAALARCAPVVVGALSHPVWFASTRCGGKPVGRRYRRCLGGQTTLCRAGDRGRAVWYGWHVFGLPCCRLCQRHVSRAWLHRLGGVDFCQMETVVRALCDAPIRAS